MADPVHLKTIKTLEPMQIGFPNRLRPPSVAGIEAVKASILELGVMKDAIHVRKMKDGSFVLIAGMHRLAAVLDLGWDQIPVVVWQCTNDWARLMEIDDNIAGADLTPLDTAIFLAERKALYEKLHPETKRGVAGGLARQNSASDIVSFAQATADKFGLSTRQIERIVAAGRGLDADQVRVLREAPKQVTIADLQTIAKIGEPKDRAKVCKALGKGDAKSATDALKTLKSAGAKAPPKDPIDVAFLDLRDRFARAPKAAKRRFVETARDEISTLLSEVVADE